MLQTEYEAKIKELTEQNEKLTDAMEERNSAVAQTD